MNRDALAKRRRALKLGIVLTRSSTFSAPSRIRLDGAWHTLDLPDEHGVDVAFMEILLADTYGLERVRNAGTILDVGAHAGLFVLAAHRTHPRARIHAYEPNPALAGHLARNAAPTGAEVHLEAIGVEDGHGTLEHAEESVNTRVIEAAGGDVKVTSFRTAVDRLGGRVDFLKLDCEGAEWPLFDDAEPWAGVQNVGLEYHGDGERAVAALERLGFTVSAAGRGPYGIVLAERR